MRACFCAAHCLAHVKRAKRVYLKVKPRICNRIRNCDLRCQVVHTVCVLNLFFEGFKIARYVQLFKPEILCPCFFEPFKVVLRTPAVKVVKHNDLPALGKQKGCKIASYEACPTY